MRYTPIRHAPHRTLIHILPAVFMLLSLFAGTARAEDEDPVDLSWMHGNWSVSYHDRLLGDVEGYAVVTVYPGQQEPRLHYYVVTDPRTGKQYELGGTSVKIEGNDLVIKLFGISPSAAVTPDGEPAGHTPPGVQIIQATPGVPLKAELRTASAQAEVGDTQPSSVTHTIRFPMNPAHPLTDYLDGRWEVEKDWRSGFQGLRSGINFDKRVDRGAIHKQVHVMRDDEVWSRKGPRIDRVTIAWMKPFGVLQSGRDTRDHSEPLTKAVWLRIEGKELPVHEGEKVVSVVFDDKNIQWLGQGGVRPDPDDPEALQIQVSLAFDMQPGRKPFTLNGAKGIWEFDFPGLEPKAIRYMRKIREGQFEQTGKLYPGEVYYLEVEFPSRPFYTDRYFQTTGQINEPVVFKIEKLESDPFVFRSKPFVLLDEDEPVIKEDGPVDRLWDPKDPDSLHPGIQAELHVKEGGVLKSTAADAQRPDGDRIWGEVEIAALPWERYKVALEQATSLRKRYPDRERYEAERWLLVTTRSTYITVQDHAALILLHQELSGQIKDYLDNATRSLAPDLLPGGENHAKYQGRLKAFAKGLVKLADDSEDHVLFLYDVSSPDGSESMPLDEALWKYPPESFAGETDEAKQQAYEAYLLSTVASAQGQAIDKAGQSYADLLGMDISEPTGLLKELGLGYERVAANLLYDLIRVSRPAEGEPFYPRWVPDKAGRAAVEGIRELALAVKADESYGSAVRLYTVIVSLPALYLVAPIAGAEAAAGTWGAARTALTALELANMGLVAHDMLEWERGSAQAELARGHAVVSGTDAYRQKKAEADAALLSALMNGGIAVGTPFFMKAVEYGLRPSMEAMEEAVEIASRRGTQNLREGTRTSFEYLRGKAEYRAMKEGFDSLTDLERRALAAAYPDGFPPEVATRLGVGSATSKLPVRDTTVGLPVLSDQAERAALSTVDDFVIDVRHAAPEQSSNPVMRRWYEGLEGSSSAAARAKQESLEAAEEMFLKLTPAEQGRAREAMEILDRLRKTNPKLANMDEGAAARMIALQAKAERETAAGLSEAIDAEELAMRIAQWNRADISPAELAAAANISELNAQAALGRSKGWASRFEGRPRGGSDTTLPMSTNEPPVTTMIDPTDVTHSTHTSQERIAAVLRGMDMEASQAHMAAAVPAAAGVTPRDAAAGVAMSKGISPAKVMESLGMTQDELRAALGRYHKRVRWEPNRVRRGEIIDDYLKSEAIETQIGGTGNTTLPPPTPRTHRATYGGLDGPAPARQAVKDEVVDALEKMGIDRGTAESLRLDDVIDRVGMNPRAVAAGTARELGIEPGRVASALDASPKTLAAELDRYGEAMLPFMPAGRRARELAGYLGGGADEVPISRVFNARAERADQALRDLGVTRTRPELVWDGLEVEAAVVGTAMDDSVSATQLMARRGLNSDQLRRHVDDYLHYGQGVTDPAKRAEIADQFIEGSYRPPDAAWRIPRSGSAAVANEDDIAKALQRMNVDPASARSRARSVKDIAANDAHAALAGAAMHSDVPPTELGRAFGLSDDQIAAKLDIYLRDSIHMKDPARRADYIANYYFGKHNGPKPSPDEVRGMIGRASPDPPAFRPRSTTTASDPALRARPTVEPPRQPVASQNLNDRFGGLQEPTYIKPFERVGSQGEAPVIQNPKLVEVTPGSMPEVHPQAPYIWSVDEHGRLLLGVETPVNVLQGEPLRLGHPTLTGGRPSRISGELKWDQNKGRWVINNLSGRYNVGHADRGYEQMRNVADLFEQSGLPVNVDYYPLR